MDKTYSNFKMMISDGKIKVEKNFQITCTEMDGVSFTESGVVSMTYSGIQKFINNVECGRDGKMAFVREDTFFEEFIFKMGKLFFEMTFENEKLTICIEDPNLSEFVTMIKEFLKWVQNDEPDKIRYVVVNMEDPEIQTELNDDTVLEYLKTADKNTINCVFKNKNGKILCLYDCDFKNTDHIGNYTSLPSMYGENPLTETDIKIINHFKTV